MLRLVTLLASAACVDCMQRVALVTGANKGIGKEIARSLGMVPDQVVILACRNKQLGMAAEQELQACGCNCVFSRLDLTDWDSICATRDFVQSQFGRLDALVNNAAISFNDPTLFGRVEFTPFEVRARMTMDTNYFGTLCVTDAFLPLLRESTWSPRIVNMASSAGGMRGSPQIQELLNHEYIDVPYLTNLMYEFVEAAEAGTHTPRWPNSPNICFDVSNMGIKALTRIYARDEPTIMVNSVDPGSCATDQNNYKGTRDPAEGAQMPINLAYAAIGSANNFVSGKHW